MVHVKLIAPGVSTVVNNYPEMIGIGEWSLQQKDNGRTVRLYDSETVGDVDLWYLESRSCTDTTDVGYYMLWEEK